MFVLDGVTVALEPLATETLLYEYVTILKMSLEPVISLSAYDGLVDCLAHEYTSEAGAEPAELA